MTSLAPHRASQASRWPPRGPVRVLLVVDQPMFVQLARLTLNHGVYDTRAVTTKAEALAVLATWQPHLVLLEMDLDGAEIMEHLGAGGPGEGRLPVIGLTRRG